MSLLEDCRNAPTTNERGYAVAAPDSVPGITVVETDVLDTTRWGYIQREVYQRGDEFVECTYEVGSGDSEIDYDPEFQAVKPVETTLVTYVPV